MTRKTGAGRAQTSQKKKMPISPAAQKETSLPVTASLISKPSPQNATDWRGQPLLHQHSAALPWHVGDGGSEQGEDTCLPYACPCSSGSIPFLVCSSCWHEARTTDGQEGHQDMDNTCGSEFACQLLPAAAFGGWKREAGGWMHRSVEL